MEPEDDSEDDYCPELFHASRRRVEETALFSGVLEMDLSPEPEPREDSHVVLSMFTYTLSGIELLS